MPAGEQSHNVDHDVVHGRVVAALLAAGRETGWVDVDPYLTGVLPRHARLAGDPTVLVDDAAYALVADPDAMLNALPPTATGDAGSDNLGAADNLQRRLDAA